MKRLVFMLFICVVFISCDDKTKEETKKENDDKELEVKETLRQLSFKIDFTSLKKDIFKIGSNDIFISNDQSMSLYISQDVKKGENSATFTFPENTIPDFDLLLYLGKEPNEILINRIVVEQGGLIWDIPMSDVEKYFNFNKFVSQDEVSKVLKTSAVDGKMNPFIKLKKKYLDQLQGF